MRVESLPEVERISALITALKLYIDERTGHSCNTPSPHVFDVPCLSSWDAPDWHMLIKDVQLIDYLVSGSSGAVRLIRSLQSYVQWQMQTEADRICEKIRTCN
ncbi:MAG TPA: hypothetical protein VMB78_05705 [Dissulfurispiraceae bacterium]|nr:hypothetical protein [Dissulfurispiraceae bacterium]